MLPSIQEIRGRVLAAVDEVFGESLGLYFLKDGAVDPDRDNATITAPFRVGGESADRVGSGVRSWSSRIASGMAEARPDAEAHPAAALIRAGDKIRALDRPGQPFFEVASIDDRAAPRLIVHLRQA